MCKVNFKFNKCYYIYKKGKVKRIEEKCGRWDCVDCFHSNLYKLKLKLDEFKKFLKKDTSMLTITFKYNTPYERRIKIVREILKEFNRLKNKLIKKGYNINYLSSFYFRKYKRYKDFYKKNYKKEWKEDYFKKHFIKMCEDIIKNNGYMYFKIAELHKNKKIHVHIIFNIHLSFMFFNMITINKGGGHVFVSDAKRENYGIKYLLKMLSRIKKGDLKEEELEQYFYYLKGRQVSYIKEYYEGMILKQRTKKKKNRFFSFSMTFYKTFEKQEVIILSGNVKYITKMKIKNYNNIRNYNVEYPCQAYFKRDGGVFFINNNIEVINILWEK